MLDVVIIIGYGPAGISTAIYLKRSGIDVTVIGKDLGALSGYKDLIENYYGFKEPISGEALIKSGIEQAKNLGIDVLTDDVIALKETDQGFLVKTKTRSFQTKVVVLATGKTRTQLKLPGFSTYRGKGISMCATCDGYFYKKKRVAVVGCGSYMAHELDYLSRITDDIQVFTHGMPLEVDIAYPVISEPILSFAGTHKITHIETSKSRYEIDGVFLAIGAPSSLEFANQLGVIIEKGSVLVDSKYQTNVPGLFATGDIIGGKLQIAKAVADGMHTAEYIVEYLKNK
jgi:thioredoxin reductase (NADPH)